MAWDVACFGELFVDLVPHSMVDGKWLYAPSPGGAPGNVAVGLAKLGYRSLMMSRVGDEAFGHLLVQALEGYGVDVSGVVLSPTEKTGVSIVTLDARGDRSFMFYRDSPADFHIDPVDVRPDVVGNARILHVGVLPLASDISGHAQRKAMDIADAKGVLVSCDLNFRPKLWRDAADMLAAGRELVSRCAIVKVSEEELQALEGGRDMDDAVSSLWHEGLRLFSVTRGAGGAVLYAPDGKWVCDGFKVDAVDTTGAGDAYTATLLSGFMRGQPNDRLVISACTAGALASTRKGAMESLPTALEIAQLMAAQTVRVSFHQRS
jgi:fructokinase